MLLENALWNIFYFKVYGKYQLLYINEKLKKDALLVFKKLNKTQTGWYFKTKKTVSVFLPIEYYLFFPFNLKNYLGIKIVIPQMYV